MTSIEDLPDIIQDIYQASMNALKESCISEVQAEQISMEAASQVRERWGGMSLYIPKGNTAEIRNRDKNLKKDFNGTNHKALANKYKISLVRVYKILKIQREENHQ